MGDVGWLHEMIGYWNTGEGEKVAAYHAEDAYSLDTPLGLRHEGREQIAKQYPTTLAFSSDSHFAIEHASCDEENYTIQWRWTGTWNSNGKPFDVRGASVGQLVGGLITVNSDYWSVSQLIDQVGPLQ